jgi:hypothetical protein
MLVSSASRARPARSSTLVNEAYSMVPQKERTRPVAAPATGFRAIGCCATGT